MRSVPYALRSMRFPTHCARNALRSYECAGDPQDGARGGERIRNNQASQVRTEKDRGSGRYRNTDSKTETETKTLSQVRNPDLASAIFR